MLGRCQDFETRTSSTYYRCKCQPCLMHVRFQQLPSCTLAHGSTHLGPWRSACASPLRRSGPGKKLWGGSTTHKVWGTPCALRALKSHASDGYLQRFSHDSLQLHGQNMFLAAASHPYPTCTWLLCTSVMSLPRRKASEHVGKPEVLPQWLN